MKRILSTLIMFFSVLAITTAQDVVEKKQSMSLGSQNGFSVEIDGADDDTTEKVFRKMMKDYGKGKRNKKAKEYYSDAIKLPMVAGANEVALYVKFDERVGLTTATAWVDTGDGFVNSDEYPKEAQGVEQLLGDIYVAVKRTSIEKELKNAEKEGNKLDKGLRKLEKKNKGYHNDIDKKEAINAIIERLNNVGKQ